MQTKQIQLTESGEVITQTDFFNAHPCTAFPQPLTDDVLAEYGARLVHVPQVPTVPASVTRRQARQALLLAGLLGNVQPAIDSIPDPVHRGMAQIEWDDSQAFERGRPLLVQIGMALGLDDAGLDALFVQAAAL